MSWVLGLGVLVIISVAVAGIMWAQRWKNAYVGVNMGQCAYCRAFTGEHLHYLGPRATVSKGNYASTHRECDVCATYPGMLHIHKG